MSLKTLAEQIRDETAEGANTATRIGDFLYKLAIERGWGMYVDNVSVNQVFDTNSQQLSINGLGSTSNSNYLPTEIRGASELWDSTENRITPISLGDKYSVRIDLEVTARTGQLDQVYAEFDIGDGSPIVILGHTETVERNPPYKVSFDYSLFSLGTFLANGCKINLYVDNGTMTVGSRSVFISREYKGDL